MIAAFFAFTTIAFFGAIVLNVAETLTTGRPGRLDPPAPVEPLLGR